MLFPIKNTTLFFCLILSGSSLFGQTSWTWRNPLATVNTFYGGAWNGRQIVLVGDSGTIVTSPDETTWTVQTSGTKNTLRGAIWTRQWFIVVGQYGTVLSSTDGNDWRLVESVSPVSLFSITRFRDLIIAVGDSGMILNLSGHITRPETKATFYSIASNDTLAVAVGDSGAIYYSINGTTWMEADPVTTLPLYSVCWVGDRFVAAGDNSHGMSDIPLFWSTDGRKWIECYGNYDSPIHAVGWFNDRIITAGLSGISVSQKNDTIQQSVSSEIRWEGRYHSPWFLNYYCIFPKGDRIIAAGSDGAVISSPDGINWDRVGTITPNRLNSVVWTGNEFVAVGVSGLVLTSTDGTSWTKRNSGTKCNLEKILWTGQRLVAVGVETFITSSDGIQWDSSSTPLSFNPTAIIHTDSQFVATGNQVVYISNDGESWSDYRPGPSHFLSDIAWNGNLFAGVDIRGSIHTSPDGIAWEVKAANILGTNLDSPPTILWLDDHFIAFGTRINSATSPDGNVWTEQKRTNYENSVFNSVIRTDNQFIAVTYQGSIMCSRDGIEWTEKFSSLTERMIPFTSIAFTGNQFVVVGDQGRILTSPLDTSDIVVVNQSTSRNVKSAISVNIIGNSLHMSLPSAFYDRNVTVEFHSMIGKKAAVALSYAGNRIAIPLDALPAGVYLCEVIGNGRKIAGKKFAVIK